MRRRWSREKAPPPDNVRARAIVLSIGQRHGRPFSIFFFFLLFVALSIIILIPKGRFWGRTLPKINPSCADAHTPDRNIGCMFIIRV